MNLFISNFNTLNQFFKRILIFVLFFTALSTFIVLSNILIIWLHPYKTGQHIETVIIGDSHTAAAGWPKYISKSINTSQKAEPLSISYFKARHIIEHNKKVKNLIIGLSYHNLSQFNDLKYKDPIWSQEMISRVYPLISLSEMIAQDINWKNFIYIYSKSFLTPNSDYYNLIIDKEHGKFPFIGGFGGFNNKSNKKMRTNKKWLDSRIKRHYYYNDISAVSDLSTLYIGKLAKLAKDENVNIYFVHTPVHRKYLNDVPKEFKLAYKEIEKTYKTKNVKFLNWSNMITQNKFYKDFDHVNREGAKKVSKRLNKIIN